MTEFDFKRLQFLISQAEKQTYVSLGKGDAVLLAKLIGRYKEEQEWQDTLNKVREKLNE